MVDLKKEAIKGGGETIGMKPIRRTRRGRTPPEGL